MLDPPRSTSRRDNSTAYVSNEPNLRGRRFITDITLSLEPGGPGDGRSTVITALTAQEDIGGRTRPQPWPVRATSRCGPALFARLESRFQSWPTQVTRGFWQGESEVQHQVVLRTPVRLQVQNRQQLPALNLCGPMPENEAVPHGTHKEADHDPPRVPLSNVSSTRPRARQADRMSELGSDLGPRVRPSFAATPPTRRFQPDRCSVVSRARHDVCHVLALETPIVKGRLRGVDDGTRCLPRLTGGRVQNDVFIPSIASRTRLDFRGIGIAERFPLRRRRVTFQKGPKRSFR